MTGSLIVIKGLDVINWHIVDLSCSRNHLQYLAFCESKKLDKAPSKKV